MRLDRKSTRLNSSHTEIYTLSLHDALPIWTSSLGRAFETFEARDVVDVVTRAADVEREVAEHAVRSEEHTSELQSHRDLHSFPTRRSSDLDLEPRPSLRDVRGARCRRCCHACRRRRTRSRRTCG